MKITNKQLIREQLSAIKKCQAIAEGIRYAANYVREQTYDRHVVDTSDLMEKMWKVEQNLWTDLLAFGLSLDGKDADEIKRLTYDRFYKDGISVQHLMTKDRSLPGSWDGEQEDETRKTLKEMFRIEEPKDEI